MLSLDERKRTGIPGPGGQERQIRAVGRLTVNNGDALRQAAVDGLGIAMLPDFIVADLIQTGALTEILTGSRREPLGIYAVYPERRLLPAKVKFFIEFLRKTFGDPPYWE